MHLEIEKIKKVFRSLWIARINAGSRKLGISYSKLINGMSKKNYSLIEKFLSDIAVSDPTFKKIVEKLIIKFINVNGQRHNTPTVEQMIWSIHPINQTKDLYNKYS